MNSFRIGLLVIVVLLAVMVMCRPAWVSDDNDFLREFINHEFFNALGVILAISLASLAQVHLHLNSIEERHQETFFTKTRKEIKSSARWLLGLFILAVVVVVVKPLIGSTQTGTAFMNAIAMGTLSMYVLILFDITMAVFSLKPEYDRERACQKPRPKVREEK